MRHTIGRYTISETLGAGGMATVFRAHDPRFDREVAIKMLHPGTLTDQEAHDKFAQEARIIALLEHHAIVPVYDFGEEEGQPYLVMRLMNGGSLKDRLVSGPLSLPDAGVILTRMCAALDKAHANHVVHRDIKPNNILFDEDGVAYLADFGIARLTDRTQTTTVIGSPRYMAPEQAQGLPLSHHTDVYQIGVVLFHMLTGHVPFDAETTQSILYQHVYADVPLLLEFNPSLPPRLDGVIGYALAKQPVDRYPSAGALASAFAKVAADRHGSMASPAVRVAVSSDDLPTATIAPQPIKAAEPPPEKERQAAQPQRSAPASPTPPPTADHDQTPAVTGTRTRLPWGWIMGLGIGAVILMVCGASIFAYRYFTNRTPAANPVIEAPVSGTAAAEQTIAAPTTELSSDTGDSEPELAPTVTLPPETVPAADFLALSPEELRSRGEGTGQIAYAAQWGGQYDIFLIDGAGTERQLTDHPDDDFRPVWSPDGRQIAYHSLHDTWEVFVMNSDGSDQRNLTNHPADDSFPQWSPDGTQIGFHSNRVDVQFDIYTMDRDGTNLRRLTDTADNDFGPVWSPDGTQIAFQREFNRRRQLMLMDADGGNIRQLTDTDGESLFPTWSPDGTQIAFHSNQDGAWLIYILTVDTEAIVAITRDNLASFYPSWSPNGEWVIYHANMGDGNRELFMSRVDGQEEFRLTDSARQERMPSWRP